MMSPSLSLCSSASRGLTHAVGSHVIFVSGFGSSWSQPLLAKRPSQIVGSGLKISSRPPLAGLAAAEAGGGSCEVRSGGVAADNAAAPAAAAPPASRLAPPVPGTHPSCSTWFQKLSALLNFWPVGSVIVQPPTWPP